MTNDYTPRKTAVANAGDVDWPVYISSLARTFFESIRIANTVAR